MSDEQPPLPAVGGYLRKLQAAAEIPEYTRKQQRQDQANARAFHTTLTDNGRRRPRIVALTEAGQEEPELHLQPRPGPPEAA
ncbi:hypothetical protein [Kitasatospora sp. NPDC057198]|uniref:hypothetical protein n=1 Tax=Kitasatospora sp. NPDC057198 TaxID=3346046 RepID=UPI003635A3A9